MNPEENDYSISYHVFQRSFLKTSHISNISYYFESKILLFLQNKLKDFLNRILMIFSEGY